MKVVYSDAYNVELNHIFQMKKYGRVFERLLRAGIITEADAIEPQPATEQQVLLVHTQEYVEKIKNNTLTPQEIFRLELAYRDELGEVAFLFCGGTIAACECALQEGVCVHIGGGFHHAYPDHGEGFCIFNDIAVGIKVMQESKKLQRAMVIDCDLHQGNGTAFIFRDDPSVFTFSIHEENNYPLFKEKSDYDIGLPSGSTDAEYMEQLKILEEIITNHKPELIVYVAGADPYEHDQLGRLKLTLEGLRRRDEYIFSLAKEKGVAIVSVYGGGYAINFEDTVAIHTNTAVAAKYLFG